MNLNNILRQLNVFSPEGLPMAWICLNQICAFQVWPPSGRLASFWAISSVLVQSLLGGEEGGKKRMKLSPLVFHFLSNARYQALGQQFSFLSDLNFASAERCTETRSILWEYVRILDRGSRTVELDCGAFESEEMEVSLTYSRESNVVGGRLIVTTKSDDEKLFCLRRIEEELAKI